MLWEVCMVSYSVRVLRGIVFVWFSLDMQYRYDKGTEVLFVITWIDQSRLYYRLYFGITIRAFGDREVGSGFQDDLF